MGLDSGQELDDKGAMRWFVEVTGRPRTDVECVEGNSWNEALQRTRMFRGDPGPMSGFSVEVRDEGATALDPAGRIRYDVRRAPDDASLTVLPSTPPSSVVVLHERTHDATRELPLTYRERAVLAPIGTDDAAVERLLHSELARLRAGLIGKPPGQYVNLAVFDVPFEGKPKTRPRATLSWKDWREAPHVERSKPLSPSTAPSATPKPSAPKRRPGDELLADLFEAVHDLQFVHDASEASELCLALAADRIPCRAGLLHLYDINKRQFVVTAARGGALSLLLQRTSERDAALATAMGFRRAAVFGPEALARFGATLRYEVVGVVASVVVAPAMEHGRFVGALELMDPLDGSPFTETEASALGYLAQQFAEMVASRHFGLDEERIRARARASGAPTA